MNLDLLFLEEVSFKLEDDIEEMTGLEEIAHYKSWTRGRKARSTKDVWALGNSVLRFSGLAIRLPDLSPRTARRRGVRVKCDNPRLVIWGLHANSSKTGGENAVRAASSYLRDKDNRRRVIGGDFNCRISRADELLDDNGNYGFTEHPLVWDGDKLNFTQWKRSFGGSRIHAPNELLHVETVDVGYFRFALHNVIDYTIGGRDIDIAPLPNCGSEQTWVNILKNFDHSPVVYEIGR